MKKAEFPRKGKVKPAVRAVLVQEMESPYGTLLLGSYEGRLCLCDWKHRKDRGKIDQRITTRLGVPYREGEGPLLDQARQELEAYFLGKGQDFNLPLLFKGTPFQEEVWRALSTIPYGTTESYQALARRVGREEAVRAVASAVGANSLSILIPCHRVIAKSGSLGGYAGGIPVKRRLLQLEGSLDQPELI